MEILNEKQQQKSSLRGHYIHWTEDDIALLTKQLIKQKKSKRIDWSLIVPLFPHRTRQQLVSYRNQFKKQIYGGIQTVENQDTARDSCALVYQPQVQLTQQKLNPSQEYIQVNLDECLQQSKNTSNDMLPSQKSMTSQSYQSSSDFFQPAKLNGPLDNIEKLQYEDEKSHMVIFYNKNELQTQDQSQELGYTYSYYLSEQLIKDKDRVRQQVEQFLFAWKILNALDTMKDDIEKTALCFPEIQINIIKSTLKDIIYNRDMMISILVNNHIKNFHANKGGILINLRQFAIQSVFLTLVKDPLYQPKPIFLAHITDILNEVYFSQQRSRDMENFMKQDFNQIILDRFVAQYFDLYGKDLDFLAVFSTLK